MRGGAGMSKAQQQISTPPDSKYFHRMLNMADDDLGPYEYRLLGHYIRVGDCWEGVRKTAKTTRMSVGKVVSTRNELEKSGYIHVEHREQDTCLVTVIDRMAENVARYAFTTRTGRSPGEQGVHVVNTSELEGVHVVNERRTRTIEEEPNKKKITTSDATHQSAVSPSPDNWSLADEAGDNSMFSPLTGKQKSARADISARRLENATATTPPPPTPAPVADVAPVMVERVDTGKTETPAEDKPGKKARKVNEGYELGIALGKAWGIPPAQSEINLYIKQAKALALDVPVEDFKLFCDWRKADAGDWAKNITIGSLLGKGYVSKYLSECEALKEKARKLKEAEERLYEMYPEARPPAPGEVIEYAPKDEVLAYMAKVTRQENVS
jgi:hypothetical protein